jgi:hypothetical protein
MGVSGAAQSQSGQPTGQVPSTGSMQPSTLGPMLTAQHNWPSVQHSVPQQLPLSQASPLHGGVLQVPEQ